MPEAWSPDHEVTPDLATALLDRQFPQLAPARATPLGAGWDNTAYLVNDVYVFRFPRRQMAVELLAREAALLPFLAPRLPLAVPRPTLHGEPDARYPCPFAGYKLLPGRTACAAKLDVSQRTAAARPLAEFLRALHAVPAEEAARRGVGPDELGRLDFAKRVPQIHEHLDELIRLKLIDDARPWRAMASNATAKVQTPVDKVLVHGDFYVRHLLVDASGVPAGVIDWGDVHLGDRAVDLAMAHLFLPPAVHDAFRQAYGPIDEQTWRLARFRALNHAVITAVYGKKIADADLLRESLTALDYLISP